MTTRPRNWDLHDGNEAVERMPDMTFYPDDPDGPETVQEAVDALVESCRDLWEVAGLPVAQAAAGKVAEGIEAWHDWWKPMDLSGPWTASWREPFLPWLRRTLEEAFQAFAWSFRTREDRAVFGGTKPTFILQDEAPLAKLDPAKFTVPLPGSFALSGMLHRDLVVQAAAIEATKARAERVGLDWDDIVRRAHEDPRDGTEAQAVRRAYEEAMDAGIRDGTIRVHEPRSFLDGITGDYLVDDGEDEVPESPWSPDSGIARREHDPHFWEGLATPPEAFREDPEG